MREQGQEQVVAVGKGWKKGWRGQRRAWEEVPGGVRGQEKEKDEEVKRDAIVGCWEQE